MYLLRLNYSMVETVQENLIFLTTIHLLFKNYVFPFDFRISFYYLFVKISITQKIFGNFSSIGRDVKHH
jgi:hypothetical protein